MCRSLLSIDECCDSLLALPGSYRPSALALGRARRRDRLGSRENILFWSCDRMRKQRKRPARSDNPRVTKGTHVRPAPLPLLVVIGSVCAYADMLKDLFHYIATHNRAAHRAQPTRNATRKTNQGIKPFSAVRALSDRRQGKLRTNLPRWWVSRKVDGSGGFGFSARWSTWSSWRRGVVAHTHRAMRMFSWFLHV